MAMSDLHVLDHSAVDHLQEAARYNRLNAWYGRDNIAVQLKDYVLQ